MPKGENGSPARNLVIVESPAKTRTLGRLLGPGFFLRASYGHVIDLPPRSFGIDVENGFQPTWKVISKKKKIVDELRRAAAAAERVYLATDPDREGEAISWHLARVLRLEPGRFARVTFHEITREAVRRAFANPREISAPLVEAQQARRILDRIVGYRLSPLLWEKVARRLSAGRVQSATLKMVVDREREIRAFQAREFWKIQARLAHGGREFHAELQRWDGKVVSLADAQAARRMIDAIRPHPFSVAAVTREEKRERPYPPFTTSLLQQRASAELGFRPQQTMRVAQQLYEGVNVGEGPVGLITYMRTDSFRVAHEAQRAARSFARDRYGSDFVPEKPRFYASKNRLAQEAHEAIRPTDVRRTPEAIGRHLTSEQRRLYDLIWRRFVASQMEDAVFDTTEATIRAGAAEFLARGRVLRFEGFYRGLNEHPEDTPLPPLQIGDILQLVELLPSQHFTEPPPRYTEASLIKAMEKAGIGRPSTYAPTLATLQERGYVRLERRHLVPTDLGILITEKLERHFPELIDRGFTARMEEDLDAVEAAARPWQEIVRSFHEGFERDLARAKSEMTVENETPAGETCPKCGSQMHVRWHRFGRMIECGCGYRRPPPGSEVPGQTCERCGAGMALRIGRFGKYLACLGADCSNTHKVFRGDRVIRIPDGGTPECPACGSPMALRRSRRGPFLGCSRYPECQGVRKIPRGWFVDLYPESKNAGEPEDPEL